MDAESQYQSLHGYVSETLMALERVFAALAKAQRLTGIDSERRHDIADALRSLEQSERSLVACRYEIEIAYDIDLDKPDAAQHEPIQTGRWDIQAPWNTLPFSFAQPLEQYRRHHQLTLEAFAAWLHLTPEAYIGMVAGDAITAEEQLRIAMRLRVPSDLISECQSLPTPEARARARQALEEAELLGYLFPIPITRDAADGAIVEAAKPLTGSSSPLAHARYAEALLRLETVSVNHRDSDYPRLRAAIEQRIRHVLNLAPDQPFDMVSWACATLDMSPQYWPGSRI